MCGDEERGKYIWDQPGIFIFAGARAKHLNHASVIGVSDGHRPNYLLQVLISVSLAFAI